MGLAGCSDAATEPPGGAATAEGVSVAQVAGYYAADLQAAERGAIAAASNSAAAPPTYHYAGLRVQYEADAAKVAESPSEAIGVGESTVSVRSFRKVGDETAGLVADIELEFERTYVGVETFDSGEVITHRVVIDPDTGQIVSVEKHDTEWLHQQHAASEHGEPALGPQPLTPTSTPTSTP